MAKPPPPLPDSDDPFVVLGLPPTARERDVRRAQARLWKLYRPSKAPAQFERVQAAVLRALWVIEVRDREQRSGVRSVASSVAIASPTPASADQPVASDEEREAWFAEVTSQIATSPEAALTRVTDPRVLGDVARDEAWSLAALRILGALAWRLPGVDDVRARVRFATSPAVAELSARVATDLDAARAYHAWHKPIMLPGLVEVVADGRIVHAAQHRANLELLREQVRVDADESLAHFDTLAERCPQLVAPLAERLLEEVPARRRDLRDLPADDVSRIEARIREVSRRAPYIQSLVALGALTAASGLALVAGGGHAGTGMGGGGIWGMYALETRQYKNRVRTLMARALVDLGVTRAVARQWLDDNRRRAMRLARFSFHMKQDRALLLLGMAAAAAPSS